MVQPISPDSPVDPEVARQAEQARLREELYVQQRKEVKARRALQETQDRPVREMLEMVGFPSRVNVGTDYTLINATDSAEKKRSGKAFNVSLAHNASMLDLMRVAATEMFHTNVSIIDKVTSTLSKPNVGFIAKAIETARVELLGDVWFSSKMALDTKDKLETRNDEQVNRGMPANYNSHIGGAVEKVIYDLGGSIDDDKIRNAMERFNKEIRAATMSMDSTAAINVAVDIAHYLELQAEEEEEEEPNGSSPGGDGDGSGDVGEQQGEGSGDPSEPQSGDAPSGGTTPNANNADETNGTETPTNTLTNEAPPEVEKVTPEELKKRLNRNLRAGVTRRDNYEKIKANQAHAGAVQALKHVPENKLYYDQHNAVCITVGSVATTISEPVKLALKTYADNHSLHEHELHKRGMPSRSTWKMNYGNMRVFEQPPKIKGHISILIDISGSMGCWCIDCTGSRENNGRRSSNAFLAWQVSAALGKIHPTAEVFAFSSPARNIGGDMQTAIYPLQAGHQPAACASTSDTIVCGGTPTCSAMLWFKEHLSQRPSNTTAIIITDGNPNGCGPVGSHHVETIGLDMMATGMKFGTVFIGNGKYLNLPAEVSINISTRDDLRNMQPLLQLLDE